MEVSERFHIFATGKFANLINQNNKSMKKVLSLVIVLAVALAAVVTNPNEEAHKEAVMKEMNNAIDTTIKDKAGLGDNDISNGLSKIVSGIASKVLKPALSLSLTVDNYYVFSVGKIGLDDNPKTVSIGAFGHVFTTFDANDL